MTELEEVLQSFLDMDMVIEDLSCQHMKVKKDHQLLTQRFTAHAQTKKGCEDELKKYQELVEKYQKMLTDFNRIKEDNNTLKANLAKAKSEKVDLEQKIIANNEEFVNRRRELEAKQRCEIEKVRQNVNDHAKSEILVYKDKLEDLANELEESKCALTDKCREHELEVSRLKLEYDSNVQKIQQRHFAMANTSSGSMSARNDIFRKKLQHLQYASENEMKELKMKCNEQAQQLSDQQHQSKIGNRQMQDLAMKHRQQMEKMEKSVQQAQQEVRRLRCELDEQKLAVKDNNRVAGYDVLAGKQPGNYGSGKKRRKVMFNPRHDRLSPSP